MIEENVRSKINDLIARAPSICGTTAGAARDAKHLSQCEGWITEALNIIELAIPIPDNSYRRQIVKIGEKRHALPQIVGSIAEILRALLCDIDAGLLANLSNKIIAEAFVKFLDYAEIYFNDGRKK